MGNQGGSAGPLREGKGSTWEGGMRVPGIAWWPGRIQPALTSELASTMDLFATALALGGAPSAQDVRIDGRDLSPLLLRGQSLPETPFFYYRGDKLAACRIGEWKAHFFTQAGYGQPNAEQHDPPLLFHLGLDPSEKRNVAAEHLDVIARIQSAVKAHQSTIVPNQPQLR
jgi:arylsulfatase A-like enzyme